jgi:hypothetical protein
VPHPRPQPNAPGRHMNLVRLIGDVMDNASDQHAKEGFH